jgi:hypothetical protein
VLTTNRKWSKQLFKAREIFLVSHAAFAVEIDNRTALQHQNNLLQAVFSVQFLKSYKNCHVKDRQKSFKIPTARHQNGEGTKRVGGRHK